MFSYKLISIIYLNFVITNCAGFKLSPDLNETISDLVDIINHLPTNFITVLIISSKFMQNVDNFIRQIHALPKTTCMFYNTENYMNSLSENLKQGKETTSLIISEVDDIVDEIMLRNVAHRLCLFIFFLESKNLPKTYILHEPLRVVVITKAKPNLYRIYYNQADPDGKGKLRFVNFYDGNGGGLHRLPIFPPPSEVYKDFKGRVLYIPVIHSPPWHFVDYKNESYDYWENNKTSTDYINETQLYSLNVIGGRDDNLLKLLSFKMNFKFEYVDPPERTQGSFMGSNDNLTFTGGLGMLQRREADMLIGDIAISLERKKAVEFSVFTLTDSGAFATHSPRNLNEALALIRPFRLNVWPILIVTVLLSGPILYLIAIAPLKWKIKTFSSKRTVSTQNYFPIGYINELGHKFYLKNIDNNYESLPKNLLLNCIWFTITVFLRQSSIIPYNSNRVKFIAIVLWVAATYVLGDVYSAQLTSQLAKPSREQPINDLYKLKFFMESKGYHLYVERQSASLEMLENGTGIFNDIHVLMKTHRKFNGSYLINSVEDGVQLIVDDYKTVVLGGRETIYFNIRRYGIKYFQLSEKLYTRYSAVAVQCGCPFIDRLNEIIMRLFEANILEKITNNEYEKMLDPSHAKRPKDSPMLTNTPINMQEPSILQPLNLNMLQGAFIMLLCGYVLSAFILIREIEIENKMFSKYAKNITSTFNRKTSIRKFICIVKSKLNK